MKLFVSALVLSVAVFQATNSDAAVKLISASVEFNFDYARGLPQSIVKQVVANNVKARDAALEEAVSHLEEMCLDKSFPSREQMDIISVKSEYLRAQDSGTSSIEQTTVEAICRTR